MKTIVVPSSTSIDITDALVAAVAGSQVVDIPPGKYTLNVDQVSWGVADGPKVIRGAGGHNGLTEITLVGAGVGIKVGASGSEVSGIRFVGSPSKDVVAVECHIDTEVTARDHVMVDLYGDQLEALIDLNGPVYYSHVRRCYAKYSAAGFRYRSDVNGYGPNRGCFLDCLTEDCDIGFDIQGGNTIEFFACRSQDDKTAVKCLTRQSKWFGGTIEDATDFAFDILEGSKHNHFVSFSMSGAGGIRDLGHKNVFTPCVHDWIAPTPTTTW